MPEQALVQARIDKQLKEDVGEIYAKLGLDIPTAIRIFFMRSKLENGIPFSMTLPRITRREALDAFEEMRRQAADVPEMTLDEINEEIRQARLESEARKA